MGKCVLMDRGVNVRVVQCLVDKHIIVLAEIMRPSLVLAVYLFAKCVIILYNI